MEVAEVAVSPRLALGQTMSSRSHRGRLTAICSTGPSCMSNTSICQHTTVVAFCTAFLARDDEQQCCRPDSPADSKLAKVYSVTSESTSTHDPRAEGSMPWQRCLWGRLLGH